MKRQYAGEPQTQGTPFQLSTNLKWFSESERSKNMCLSKHRCHVSSHAGYVKPAPLEVKSLHPLTRYPPKTQTLWIASHHLHSGAHSLQTGSWPTWSSLEQGRTSHLTELSCCWACLTESTRLLWRTQQGHTGRECAVSVPQPTLWFTKPA